MVDNKQGVGSIWNKGNWHWEERNYKDFATQWLKSKYVEIAEETADAKITIYEVKSLTGSASVTIRKQKQIFMFEFEGELYFKAVHKTDERQDVMGRIKMHEFNQEDDEIATELTCEKDTPWAQGVKTFMRKQMPHILYKTSSKLVDAMKEKDMDEQRLADAKQRSEQAAADYKKVNEETQEQKLQIAAERKQKEEEMKKAEAIKQASQPQPVKQVQKIEGQGSVWNTNSYHWEEKSVNKWAEEHLKKVISNFQYKWNDAVLVIKEIKTFKGESSVSIRKGKKIVAYDYNIIVSWQVDMYEADKSIAYTKGQYEFPELSNDEADDWEVRVSFGEDTQGIQNVLQQMVRTFAPKDLKTTIKTQFVEELQKK